MRKTLLFFFTLLVCVPGFGQTTLNTTIGSTGYTGTNNSGVGSFITFIVENATGGPIVMQSVGNWTMTTHNGTTSALWYTSTSLSGPVTLSGPTWTQVASNVVSGITTTGVNTVIPTMSFNIPPGAIYRFALNTTGTNYYSGFGTVPGSCTPNSFTANGITLRTGDYQIAGQYVGYGFTNNPRFFTGFVTFAPNFANDIKAQAITQPLNNAQICHNLPLPIKALIKNSGTAVQSNFPVSANFTGPVSGTLTTTYTGSLAPNATDTVTFGPVLLFPGNYSVKAYTQLATDSLKANDTSGSVNFTIKPAVATPVVNSDTVCPGGTAYIFPDPVLNAVYNWYDEPASGSLVYSGPDLLFPNLPADTVLYVTSTLNGCESDRVLISAALGAPPVVNFGSDTAFCESIPLVLNAGNPGGNYTWSTGDSTQSITVTNVSGLYWVEVDHYCLGSDTIMLNIAPIAKVDGISYVREANTYHFSPSGSQNVLNYLWIFGDGFTSTQINPVHTYAMSITWNLDVKLVVSNGCGTDTAVRMVPTAITDPGTGDEGLSIYPNPASEELFIRTREIPIEKITLFNSLGAMVLNQEAQGRQSEYHLDVSNLAAGSYLVRILTREGYTSKNLLISR